MRGYNLDLLRYLQLLIEEESVTAAARRMRISEPAMSRNLSKLRQALSDEILIKSGARMIATDFAKRVLAEVQSIVMAADNLGVEQGIPKIREMPLSFTIRANDIIVASLGIPLLEALREECPKCEICFAPETDDGASEPLRDGSIDLYIGATDKMTSEIQRQTLFRDIMYGVVRKNHPILKAEITPQRLASFDYISVSRRGKARGPIDWTLRDHHGLTRRVAMIVPTYHTLVGCIGKTNFILPLPGIVIRQIEMDKLGLASFKFPLPLPYFEGFQSWHPRRNNDPIHKWFRKVVFRVSRDVYKDFVK